MANAHFAKQEAQVLAPLSGDSVCLACAAADVGAARGVFG